MKNAPQTMACPSRWRDIYHCRKSIANWPPTPDFWDRVNERELIAVYKLSLVFFDEHGVTIEGLTLILTFTSITPCDGGAVLVLNEGGSSYHLGRFDFGASEAHSNRRATSDGVKDLPAMVRGSHLHGYDINEKLGKEAFAARGGCPPAAQSIDSSSDSFRARMRQIGEEFNIDGLENIPPPPFQGDMLK